MTSQDPNLHIAILPWLAFGHLIPFLQLAIALANIGHRISFISTPKNIHQLLPKVPRHLLPLLSFITLPLPRIEGLPENAESTTDLTSYNQSHLLKSAYDLLRQPVKDLLVSSSPDWIVHDFAAYWAGTIAKECGIGSIFLTTFPASVMAFAGPLDASTRTPPPTPESMMKKPDWIPFPNSKLAFKKYEAEQFIEVVLSDNTSGVSDCDRMSLCVKGSHAVAVRSCHEYEGEYLDLLPGFMQKPTIPVGLLPPAEIKEVKIEDSWVSVFKWLDEQQPKSVVYVSFGSEYKLSKEEVHELAIGLEQSDVPFLWALKGQTCDALPVGFEDRTRGRGVVAVGWAPQSEILAHPSIGGSMFHCGYGSIVETIRHGHTLICLPFIFDQGLNARFLVEKGWGIEVERNEDGSFSRDEIARALTVAMVSDEGAALRRRAREAGAVLGDQRLHDQYVRKFAEYLLNNRGNFDA